MRTVPIASYIQTSGEGIHANGDSEAERAACADDDVLLACHSDVGALDGPNSGVHSAADAALGGENVHL